MCILIFLTHGCLTQNIEINEYPIGNGFIMINVEEPTMIKHFTTILHVIDINKFNNSLNSIKETLKLNYNNINIKNINQSILQIEDKIFELSRHNHSRNKRGAMNGSWQFLKLVRRCNGRRRQTKNRQRF